MRKKLWWRSAGERVGALLALPALLGLIYFAFVRPAQLRWGATEAEVRRAMPGDELVPRPSFSATRAIAIAGTPEEVWPWLAQMGFKRAGFYGYDLIENLGNGERLGSQRAIVPELQHPQPGDVLPISAVAQMYFGQVEEPRYIVWRGASTPSDGTIVWALYPAGVNETRLVSRVRLHYHWGQWRPLTLDLFTEFGDSVAVVKILRGVRQRVEGGPAQTLVGQALEIVPWLAALAELAAGAMMVLVCRRWGRAWLLALAAGLVLLFVLYAHASPWYGAALTTGVLAAMAWPAIWRGRSGSGGERTAEASENWVS